MLASLSIPRFYTILGKISAKIKNYFTTDNPGWIF